MIRLSITNIFGVSRVFEFSLDGIIDNHSANDGVGSSLAASKREISKVDSHCAKGLLAVGSSQQIVGFNNRTRRTARGETESAPICPHCHHFSPPLRSGFLLRVNIKVKKKNRKTRKEHINLKSAAHYFDNSYKISYRSRIEHSISTDIADNDEVLQALF